MKKCISVFLYSVSFFMLIEAEAFSALKQKGAEGECIGQDQSTAQQLEDRLHECLLLSQQSVLKGDGFTETPRTDDRVYQACSEKTARYFKNIQSVSCKTAYLSAFLDNNAGVLFHRILQVGEGTDSTLFLESDLKAVLRLFDIWISQLEASLLNRPDTAGLEEFIQAKFYLTSSDLISGQVEQILRSFWQQIVKLTRSNPDFLKQKETFAHGLKGATEILSAAIQRGFGLDGHQTLNHRILYRLLSHLLMPVIDRASLLAEIHDFQCELKACRDNHTTAKRSSFGIAIEILRLLDRHDLIREDKLRKYFALLEEVQNKEVRHFLRTVLRLVPLLHIQPGDVPGVEGPGVAEYQGQPFSAIPEGLASIDLRQFLAIISDFSEMYFNFKHTGFFLKKRALDLEFGITPENIQRVGEQTRNIKTNLDREIELFDRSVGRMGGDLKDSVDAQSQFTHITQTLRAEMEQLNFIQSDLAGSQASLRDIRDRFARYSQEALRLFSSNGWKNREEIRLLPLQENRVYAISASHARYQHELRGSSGSNIMEVAVQIPGLLGIQAEAQDVITFQIDGRWAPTCALVKSSYWVQGLENALIGPEGFMVSEFSADAKIESAASFKSYREYVGETKSQTTTKSITASVNLPVSVMSVNSSISRSLSQSSVQGMESSLGRNNSSTSSQENRRSASFDLGLRLEATPFPDLPAGSLLLVEMKRGSQSLKDVLNIQIVRSNSTFVIKKSSDIYFVVNDCVRPDIQSLGIHLTHQRPQGPIAKQMSENMVRASAIVAEDGRKYLRSGNITMNQMAALHAKALNQVVLEGEDPQQVRLLFSLFESWVLSELDQLETEIRILNLERQLKVHEFRIRDFNQELEFLKDRKVITNILHLWEIDNHDLLTVGPHLRRSIEFLRHSLLPVIKLRYSSMLKHYLDYGPDPLRGRLDKVEGSLSLEGSVGNIAKTFSESIEPIVPLFERAQIHENIEDNKTIVISFPRVIQSNLEVLPEFVSTSHHPTANPLYSVQPWRAFFDSLNRPQGEVNREQASEYFRKSLGTFKVSPEDLYVANTAYVDGKLHDAVISGALPCHASAPIVEAMGVYFLLSSVPDGEGSRQLNEAIHSVELMPKTNFQFPMEEGLEEFTLTRNWTALHVPVFYGDTPTPAFTFMNLNREKMGKGISPFGEFELQFSNFNFSAPGLLEALDKYVKEIMLVFKVNYRVAEKNLEWLPRCNPANL